MNIYLATARLDDIRWAAAAGVLDGVLTTPALVGQAGVEADYAEHLDVVAREARVPVIATVRAVRGDDIYRDARELVRDNDEAYVQVPLVEDALPAIRRLATDGVRVFATLVFTPAQALLAAKAGAAAVGLPIDQLAESGGPADEVLGAIREMFERHDLACELVAMFPRNAGDVAACARGGADAIVVTPDTLRELLVHPMTDRGLDRFLREITHKSRTRA